MKKIIFRSIVSLLLTIFVSILYLSTIGIKTDRFNNQISKQIKKIDPNLKIELKKLSILLNPTHFEIKAKTIGTNLKYKEKIIGIETINFSVKIKSLLNKKPYLSNLNISTKSLEMKNLISFIRLIKNDTKFYIAERLTEKGYIVANINIKFDEAGNIKNNYEINGFIRDAQINLFNRYDLSKIDLKFNLVKDELKLNDINLSLNNNYISIPHIKSKKEKKIFYISGKANNKKINLNKTDFDNLTGAKLNNFEFEKLEFGSENSFSFEINEKFKIKNFKIKSNIELEKLVLINKFNLIKIFPKLKKEIQLENHSIILEYDKDNLNIKGNGEMLLQNKYDKIQYDIVNTKKNLVFKTKIDISDNSFKLDFLNYQKKPGTNLEIKIKGKKNSKGITHFDEIFLKEEKNTIKLSNLLVTDKNKVKKIESISLDYLDKEKIKNKIQIVKKKDSYILSGESLNINEIINKLLKSENDNKNNFFKDNFTLKINVKKTYVDKENTIKNLKGYLVFNDNQITNANLESIFSNNKKVKFTVKSSNDEKITTFFSEYPKPLVKRYKFIKGFDKGVLDFYSVKKDNISNSVLIIDNFKLKEVPVLAKILTLASLQGIADLLTGEGIRFTDFEMKFSNKDGLITIDEMYAIGPAISILLEGYIETKKLISLRGTLVPATTINRSIASLPLIGNILVGKKVGEGVFGVSFKIKGPPKNLETTVNPIKTLTPRFITRTLEKIKKN